MAQRYQTAEEVGVGGRPGAFEVVVVPSYVEFEGVDDAEAVAFVGTVLSEAMEEGVGLGLGEHGGGWLGVFGGRMVDLIWIDVGAFAGEGEMSAQGQIVGGKREIGT